jgi:uncharacterized membrane protein
MSPPADTLPGKSRIEALSDGVFAIAMTLLILGVRLPAGGGPGAPIDLVSQLQALGPRLLAYPMSFPTIGVSWAGPHAQIHYIRRSERIDFPSRSRTTTRQYSSIQWSPIGATRR